MIYQYNSKVVNTNGVDDFFNKKNFVGYILPDGSIYECKNHNVENVKTFIKMSLFLIKDNYSEREKFISADTNSPLMRIVSNYIKKTSYNELMALNSFIEQNNLEVSDLLVGLFGCHEITRGNKTILTALSNHEVFYNYLLNGFTVNTVNKIVYDEKNNTFIFKNSLNRNIETYNEIDNIKKDIFPGEEKLFHKR